MPRYITEPSVSSFGLDGFSYLADQDGVFDIDDNDAFVAASRNGLVLVPYEETPEILAAKAAAAAAIEAEETRVAEEAERVIQDRIDEAVKAARDELEGKIQHRIDEAVKAAVAKSKAGKQH